MNAFDKQILAHYATKALPQESVERILAASPTSRRFRRWDVPLGVAAVVLLAFGLLANYENGQSLTDRVLREIAMNHVKALDIEVAATDYTVLQSRLDRIDFEITPGKTFRESYELEGGRYCSIQGGLAAQLKVKHRESGIIHTLYVTRLTSTLKGLEERGHQKDQTPIRLWKDENRFFGLAGGPVQ